MSELFVVQGSDRNGLLDQIERLIKFLDGSLQFEMKDLAFTLNLKSDFSKLAIIANEPSDLRAKLLRAKSRLQDPNCQHIHDVTGIYYVTNGLQSQGKLAFLFPGEGAQYINMLGDLRQHFPSVQEFITLCDELSREGKPISQLLYVPDTASAEDKLQAETALKSLGNAMFSVMMVDWALYILLGKLGLKPDCAAGHSMGELVALGTSGYLDTNAAFFDRVNRTLESKEIAHLVPEVVLLAVGAGKSTVKEIVDKLWPGHTVVYVAMCNCPHQSVAVGPKEAIALVEAELHKRSILTEHLPFSRPYHTPLFSPLLPHLDAMFDGAEFRSGKTPVYSCSSARLFPNDPVEIRRLAVSHWASPVEFTQMIENMYADGVRIFVEVGPRGNLSAFVADILQGRPHAALASNVQRRSGLSQLHHLAGQLLAHGVPMDLTEFYCHRSCTSIPLESKAIPSSSRTEVMSQYLDVMQQFLDLQHDFMHKYLGAKRTLPAYKLDTSTMPLAGTVVRYEPGKLLVMTRTLDLQEDLFASHHTIGGRTLSKVSPDQYGLPVSPGTFSLELSAEVASLLVPGLVVTALKNVRLMRWLAYEDGNPTKIEITAKVLEDKTSVQIELYDHGTTLLPLNPPKIALKATVELSERYPEPLRQAPFTLTNERPSSVTLEVLQQNLFHGPIFQGMRSTDKFGEEGVEGTIQVMPRNGILTSNFEPKFILDPVLTDVSMHPLVSWHLEHKDQSGRILLPAEIARVELFAPPQPEGTRLISRGTIVDSSSRHFTHDVEVASRDGKVLFRLSGAKFWRFYVPFDKVNFHGPKDEYFLSREWNPTVGNSPSSCMRLNIPADLRQPGMRLVTSRVTLSPWEQKQFTAMQANDSRLDDWLFGRITAKDAIRTLWTSHCGEKLFLADIEIEPDSHGRPVGRYRDAAAKKNLPSVSIAHTEGIVVALASFQPHVGIDIEQIKPREASFEDIAFDVNERELLSQYPNRAEGIARFWCAKEAVAKALGLGLIEGPQSLFVKKADIASGLLHVALGKELSSQFPAFSNQLLTAYTEQKDDLIVATSFCEVFIA